MNKFSIVQDKNISKGFKGGTSSIYLYIFIIVAFLHVEFADYQLFGLDRLTEDYSKDEIFMSIIQYVFITYIAICFTSETLKVKTLIIVQKTYEYIENLLKKYKIISYIKSIIKKLKIT
jgi:hypothetical protein